MKYLFLNSAIESLATGIAHRIENPRGDKDAAQCKLASQAKTLSQRSNTFGKRKVGKSAYRTGMIRLRTLSAEDREDIFQTVQGYLVSQILSNPGKFKSRFPSLFGLYGCDVQFFAKGDFDIFPIFRECRKFLKMNGGNHDREFCDSLDWLLENGRDFSLTADETSQALPLAIAENLQDQAQASFAADTSRKRTAAFKACLHDIDQLSGLTENGFTSQAHKRKTAFNVRKYLSIGCKGTLAKTRAEFAKQLAADMATQKPDETPKQFFRRIRANDDEPLALEIGRHSTLPTRREIVEIATSRATIVAQWICENGNHGIEIA